eukprot:TRINITY_DN966_c0_g1_i3.p1 TRINITY_DN966_c0_g1~~TRINITY_DN966_c0_g1_i3.p1  ORF type:complete len:487 (+),score=214.34 TRINITY_DN966_c0_g1_i3:76-1461(+)
MAPKAAPKADAKAPKTKKEPKSEEEEKEKVQAPDRDAFDAKLAKIQEEIDKLTKKKQAFGAKISERSGGKDEFFTKKAELKAQLDELSDNINKLYEKKDAIQKQVGDKKAEGSEMRKGLKDMKKSLNVSSESDIQDKIAEIELKLRTESMPLKEEKKLVLEIQNLKKARPKIAQVASMEAKVASFDPGMNMKEQLDAIYEEMTKWREAKKAVQEKMTALNETRKEQLGDLPEIIEQQKAIGEQIQAKIKERNEVRDAFRQEERAYNAHLQEIRKARQEKIAQERAERAKENETKRKMREVEKLDEQPYVSEMTLIEQTIAFCKSLTKTKAAEEEAEKKEVKHDNPDTHEVLLRKEDREEEFFFAPTKGKKASKKSKQAAGGSGGKATNIKHNAETFRLFDQLKLDAPITTDDVPALLEKLDAQLEEYKAKVKEWEDKREDMKKDILASMEKGEGEEEKKEE